MKSKYIKYGILVLGIITAFAALKTYINDNDVVFNGGWISSYGIEENTNSYIVGIDLESGYNQEQIEYFTNIATRKRTDQIDFASAQELGVPTQIMMVFISEKSTGITKWNYEFNLWLYNDRGYIQPINDSADQSVDLDKISELNTEEYNFLVNTLLKYHTSEEIFREL